MKGRKQGNGKGFVSGDRAASPGKRRHIKKRIRELEQDLAANPPVRPQTILPPPPPAPKKPRKPKGNGDPLANELGRLAPELVQMLHDRWPDLNAGGLPDGGYAMARGVVAELVFGELARARGMQCTLIEHGADASMRDACSALRERVRHLPLEQVTSDHFGCVHEALTGFRLVAGKVASSRERRVNGVHYTPPELAMKVTARTVEPLLECIGEQSPLVLRICDAAVGAGAFLLALMRMLAPLVLERGEATNLEQAKRLVAMHVCHGVDVSRYAVHSCKLALTLEARADRMPRDWLDDNIKHGDGLVGLTHHHVEGAGERARTTDSQFTTFDWRGHRADFRPTAAHEATRALIDPLYHRAINQAATARLERLARLAEIARAS
jgi:hypothetical protein